MNLMQNNPEIQSQLDYIQKMCKALQPEVVVKCMVYNQENYIKETLDGFVKQKTNFPFVVIIHDDASTDHSQEILRSYVERYPNLFLPIFEQQNLYSKRDGSLDRILFQAILSTKAKYIGICEGDDYWIDDLKLQKQKDFLDVHPDYGMCYGLVQRYSQQQKKLIGIGGSDKCSFRDIVHANRIPTLTVLYRSDLFRSYYEVIKPFEKKWKMGDKPLWLWIALKSNIYFMQDLMGVYRITLNSASHTQSFLKWLEFIISANEIELFFLKLAGQPDSMNQIAYSAHKLMEAIEIGDRIGKKRYRKQLCKNFKYPKSRQWLLYMGLIICPNLTTKFAKKFYLYRNQR